MSCKLRELIREVRQCKSASAERSVINKELANIRTAIKRKDQLEHRHRNVAKLMYCDMLGYPTYFGQMDVLKLLASKPFVEKRLGYLALMQLLDENTEVLMLATQSLKQDMCHENPFIVGLALCAMGNIASTDISRDLAREVEKLLKHSNPYIRKKALCTAIRVIARVPEMSDEYFKCAVATLEDSGQGHGPSVGAVQLLYSICRSKQKHCKRLRKYSSHIIGRLSSLLRSSYDPDHDIGGVTDPFLQVHLLKLLRLISKGDTRLSEEVDSTLAQIATNTESNKNPGNSILYECVRTIMSIEKQSSLHVLAINILGRFLVNRDNNVRYVALNALCNAVYSNTDAIQRHRNTIVECLKDADLTIRRRALDLIYALTNKKNIRSLARDLLSFLTLSNTTTAFEVASAAESPSPSKDDRKHRKGRSKKRAKRDRERERAAAAAAAAAAERAKRGENNGQPTFIEASSLSVGELEFRQELASKICMVVERYAPNRKWHIDTIVQVMATTTNTGFNREQEVVANLFILVSNTPELQSYCTFKLVECLQRLRLDSDPIRQITAWLLGEYGHKLMDPAECEEANETLQRPHRDDGDHGDDDDDDEEGDGDGDAVEFAQRGIESMTRDIGPFRVLSADEVVAMAKYIARHDQATAVTKGYALTALLKLRHKLEGLSVDRDEKITSILEHFRDAQQIEVQQRSVEFVSLFSATDWGARQKILKPMPVPKIERLFDQKTKAEMKMDSDPGSDTETESSSTERGSSGSDGSTSHEDSSESEEESVDSLASDSDDSTATKKRKRKQRKKRDKLRRKEQAQKEAERESKSKKKKKRKKREAVEVVVPKLSGPDDLGDGPSPPQPNGGGGGTPFGGAPPSNGHSEQMNGGRPPQRQQGAASGDLLNFGAAPSGGDFLGDLMGNAPPSGTASNVAAASTSTGSLEDILGIGPSPTSQPLPSSPGIAAASGPSKAQPFSAYNKDGITATFNFQPNNAGHGVCRVLAVFHNSNSYDVHDFSFMIAVPKYIKLQFKPANGTQLLALSQNSITQKFQLSNSQHGVKPFIIRVQVQYTRDGQHQKDRAQVQFPDNCC